MHRSVTNKIAEALEQPIRNPTRHTFQVADIPLSKSLAQRDAIEDFDGPRFFPAEPPAELSFLIGEASRRRYVRFWDFFASKLASLARARWFCAWRKNRFFHAGSCSRFAWRRYFLAASAHSCAVRIIPLRYL
jgi:hypothetical protein